MGLVITVVSVAFEGLAITTVMPTVVRDLHGLGEYGWAFSAFMLANLVGITTAGQRTDRVGPFAPFASGLLLFATGLALAGAAPSMAVLIGARAIQGAGGGALSSVLYASVARCYPEDQRPRMLALLSTAWVVPGLIGPGLAGLIADHASWRLVFVGLIPIGAVAGALTLPVLRGIAPAGVVVEGAGGPRAAILLSGGVVLMLLGLEPRWGWPALGLVAVGVVTAAPGFRELLPAGTLAAAPGLPAAVAAMGLVSLAFFGAETFLPLAATTLHGASSALAGLALSAATLTWTTGAWVQARLAPTASRRTLVGAGVLVIVLGLAMLALPLAGATSLRVLVAAWAVVGLGMGIAHATISLVVLEQAPSGGEGAASAAMQLAGVLGIALGAGLGGVALAAAAGRGWPPRAGFLVALAITGGAGLLALATAARLPGRPPTPLRIERPLG